MPWVNQAMCTGCEVCIEECPVDAIELVEGKGFIKNELCIRCGKCHDSCPEEAIRHDSERIPEEIATNLDRTRTFLKYFTTTREQEDFIERMKRFYNKERKVAEKTISELQDLGNQPNEALLEKANLLRQQMKAKM